MLKTAFLLYPIINKSVSVVPDLNTGKPNEVYFVGRSKVVQADKDIIADKIKMLREKRGITQAELARKLGVTRTGVNAWEMGISVPSTQYIAELSVFFGVSVDYLLGLNNTSTISVEGLSDREIASILEIIQCYKNNKGENRT